MNDRNLGTRFERITDVAGDEKALIFPQGEIVTYRELDAEANRWARLLQSLGATPRSVVCIAGEKRRESFAAMLGCLKLGAAYCILDPESPVARLSRILDACQPAVIVATARLEGELRDRTEPRVVFDAALGPKLFALSDERLDGTAQLSPTLPAYVMFTSGSTGFPKGAVMTHENVSHLIAWSEDAFGFGVGEILTNLNPLYFDNSVFDFFSSLFTGAALAPLSKRLLQDPVKLIATVESLHCTSWFSVPSVLMYVESARVLGPETLPAMRRIVFGGEGYPKSRLQVLHRLLGDRVELVNVYGPTECTCICSAHWIGREDFDDLAGFPVLGHLTRGFEPLIVGPAGMPVRPGEVGELCLLGPQVGGGYWNDTERTSDAFVQTPCHARYRELMYRTGDLVRQDPVTGILHIHGRADNQVKVMGHRVELEEVELAMSRVPGVRESVAVLDGKDLVGVVSAEPDTDERLIRATLRSLLPSYMIPVRFAFAGALPKNANGKVDRRAAREHVAGGYATGKPVVRVGRSLRKVLRTPERMERGRTRPPDTREDATPGESIAEFGQVPASPGE